MQGRGRELPWEAAPSVRPDDRPEGRADEATIRIEETRMWHITLTVAGQAVPPDDIRRALERLAHDHPFLLAGRYATDQAEIRYWEEARDLQDAAALALRLWGEHRRSAGLPQWEIIGLEVVDRGIWQLRAKSPNTGPVIPGGVQPF
ncbi:hypothetical protein [Yinghuangia seranimata]|uniref:hypothetical protein n=1 Tax=Yinghuangia seranimata TaxID=408067 RepID=UPI00248B664B|nr:hypothetical protein [Yinghuangia seranimata]MDI2127402.1 hypothetical protein [Yinghuangia seranimata]